jgi:hypothetical protein
MKQVRDFKVGDIATDRGRSFVIKEIRTDPEKGWIALIDTEGRFHGYYNGDEYLADYAIPQALITGGVRLSTARFVQLLQEAREWDHRHSAMRNAQTEWLLENFVVGDSFCAYASLEQRRQWDLPRIIGGKLFTRCG